MHNKTIHMWVTLWVVGSTEVHNVGHVCGALRYLLWIIWVTFVGHLGHFCTGKWVTFVGHVGKCRGSFGSPVRVTWVTSLGRLGQVCKSVGSRLWGNVHMYDLLVVVPLLLALQRSVYHYMVGKIS